jgi:uncharacterized protein (AIM24 family)
MNNKKNAIVTPENVVNASNAPKVIPQSAAISSTLDEVKESGIIEGPFKNLNARIENKNGYDTLLFNLTPGTSVITNQNTLSYMDGGLTTNITTGSGGLFSTFLRSFTGSSILQNIVLNPLNINLKMCLSPLMQSSIIQINIKSGETWRFANKIFIACTPNLNVSGDINIFSNFRMLFVGGNITYTTIAADKGSDGVVWISAYGAVEKHEIQMGSNPSPPLYINNGCFLCMISRDSKTDYWGKYVKVGLASSMFNAIFTQLGFIMKIKDTSPTSGDISVSVYTQSLNPANLERYIASISKLSINPQIDLHIGGKHNSRKKLKV